MASTLLGGDYTWLGPCYAVTLLGLDPIMRGRYLAGPYQVVTQIGLDTIRWRLYLALTLLCGDSTWLGLCWVVTLLGLNPVMW